MPFCTLVPSSHLLQFANSARGPEEVTCSAPPGDSGAGCGMPPGPMLLFIKP